LYHFINHHTVKKTILPLFLLVHLFAFAQKGKAPQPDLFVFDADWKSCKPEKAKYLGCLYRINDTAWQWRYYNFVGPLISIETYKDKDNTIPHGYFAFFDNGGRIDSSGYTFEGKKDREWLYFTDSLAVFSSEEYNKGKLIQRKDAAMLKAEKEQRRRRSDSLTSGSEKEASYPGGVKTWTSYLQKKLQFPQRALNMGQKGTVRVVFVVDTDGTPIDVSVHRSVEFSLDEEAQRLVLTSSKWEPAIQNGKKVKAYIVQPITFAR
jgi:TonB family protein